MSVATLAAAPAAVQCAVCQWELPLRSPKFDEAGVDWVCTSCESVYHGVLLESCPAGWKNRVKLTAFRFEEQDLPPVPEALKNFSYRINASDIRLEKRDSIRRPYCVPIIAMELSPKFQPLGRPFQLMTRDISASGVGLVAERRIASKLLAVELPPVNGKPLQLAVEIVRHTMINDFFDIGGKFVCRMFA